MSLDTTFSSLDGFVGNHYKERLISILSDLLVKCDHILLTHPMSEDARNFILQKVNAIKDSLGVGVYQDMLNRLINSHVINFALMTVSELEVALDVLRCYRYLKLLELDNVMDISTFSRGDVMFVLRD